MQAAAFGRDNARGVLAAVLQDREAVKEHLIDLCADEIRVRRRRELVSIHKVLFTATESLESNIDELWYSTFVTGVIDVHARLRWRGGDQ